MLEGREFTEANYSELKIAKRFDANYFVAAKGSLIANYKSKNYVQLQEVVEYISSGHTPYKHDITQGEIGFITVECIKNLSLDESKLKRITKKQFTNQFKNNRAVENSLVCTIKRRICQTYPFIEEPYKPLAMNQDVSFMIPKSPIRASYIATYLNCAIGQKFADRQRTEQINPYLSVENLSSLPIIIPSFDFQLQIENVLKQAYAVSDESKRLYKQAENLLLESVGLKDFEPSKEKTNVKNFSESFLSTGRLDAEYYQPKYEKIISAVKANSNGFDELAAFIEDFSTGYPFESESYIKEGIPLIRINNIKKGELDLSNAAQVPEDDVSLSPKDLAKENDILISMSGTIGNSCKIPHGVIALINQRIMRITPKNYNFNVLPLIINSVIGEFQLERIGTGGVQTNISATDIKKILIPILESEKQKEISELIEESFRLKKESENLLEIAKRAVEMAIEETEEKAIEFIEDSAQ